MGSVLDTILVFALSMMPPLLSLWVMRKAEEKARERLRSAMQVTAVRQLQRTQMPLDQHYLDGVGYLIGDISCQFNARSPYIRCAVNPLGPCQECPHYQPRDEGLGSREKV
jgi:hypothetical protein